MPPKLPPCKLSGIDPTREEIEEALAFIRGASAEEQKKKRALQSSMMQWLKQNVEEGDNATVIDSRGEEREANLVKFYAFQARSKEATRKVENVRSLSKQTQRIVEMHEWGKETMDQELGRERAESLRASGRINFKPCPLTGSSEEHMKVSSETYLNRIFEQLVEQNCKDFFSEMCLKHVLL